MSEISLRTAVAALPAESREVIHGMYGLMSDASRCVHGVAVLLGLDVIVTRERLVAALQTLETPAVPSIGPLDGLPPKVRDGYMHLHDDLSRGSWRHHALAISVAQNGTPLKAGHGCPWPNYASIRRRYALESRPGSL